MKKHSFWTNLSRAFSSWSWNYYTFIYPFKNTQLIKDLFKNLEENCIPNEIFEMEKDDYQQFLTLRRKLMARKIKGYFERLW